MSRKLLTAADYFSNVVEPNFAAFKADPVSFHHAFNVVTALYHVHEWLFAYHRAEIEAYLQRPLPNHWNLWGYARDHVLDAGYVKDLANASKHVTLSRGKDTEMSGVDGTEQVRGFGMGGVGVGPYGQPYLVIRAGERQVVLSEPVDALFAFWRVLMTSAGIFR